MQVQNYFKKAVITNMSNKIVFLLKNYKKQRTFVTSKDKNNI